MNIKEDYSYISNNKMKLVNMGYAKIGIYSINFDRYFTNDEVEENIKQSEILSSEDWNKRCDEFSRKLNKQIEGVISVLNNNYDIHQISEEKSSMQHFRSDWDIFFYSNKGWNKKDHYDYVQLTFNDKRNTEDNMRLKDNILELIKNVDNTQNVGVRVQYGTKEDVKKINKAVAEQCELLQDKMINHMGQLGKIKVVGKDKDYGYTMYGFFPKGSKKKYYKIDYVELLTSSDQNIAV